LVCRRIYYDKNELKALHDCCKELGIYLYVDGARLGCAIALDNVDLSFEDMPKVCDAFYIGGTKNGAMFGEALVIDNDDLCPVASIAPVSLPTICPLSAEITAS